MRKFIVGVALAVSLFMPHLASAQIPNPNCPKQTASGWFTTGAGRVYLGVVFCTQ